MQAMIFSAGLGTRLAPLTDNKPKALVDFLGKPMLENVAKKLIKAGCNRLIINVHHFPEMICDFIAAHNNFGVDVVISNEKDQLLDTGGGILKIKDELSKEQDFILYNVDIACDIDIKAIYDYHKKSQNLATLAVKNRKSTRNLIFDNNMQLCGWRNLTTGETKIARPFNEKDCNPLAFSGISVVSSNIFPLITETGKFSITNLYLRLASSENIGGYIHDGLWADLDTVEKLKAAEKLFG